MNWFRKVSKTEITLCCVITIMMGAIGGELWELHKKQSEPVSITSKIETLKRYKFEVEWQFVRRDHISEFCEQIVGYPPPIGKRFVGCMMDFKTGTPPRNACLIFTPRPVNDQDVAALSTIGHELYHCVNFGFHDKKED